jgi:hypothetical protein
MSQPHNPKEESKMKLYGAIDLHSTNNATVLIDEEAFPQRLQIIVTVTGDS